MLPGCVPGILGARVADAVRWRANRAGLNRSSRVRAGARGWWHPDVLRQLVGRHVTGRDNQAPALGVVLTLELFARAFLDPQEQERLGLDALDQVQLRDAAGWLVCTENVAPAAVAVHETPVDTLIPGKASQGPE